ncbi:23S rRNA (pseudouridine(1915)-N(3))-methyltransferase RlmH [Palleronia sp. LCG004]|uniref:23S rRNA (pseudouridine(1915)-N(3))-methyltransferase RlmH n=1 Tax=Palleronia sp. LCG004 TaxID=3079304 RepID=UPI002943F730|nr:23S rRNA (pseudouridine(1915)-N(3))-methyltransferase RlmH [Palleronia sp. LCG004]WOI56020.1 23S rRNA (pseudouridine(1915)-N(3))-methyltransferase RlmH [Palleronia sp. LCG004]
MKIHIVAMGRIRSGPERALIDDYSGRFDRTGRPLSLGPLHEIEIDTRKAQGAAAEADALRRAVPDGALICALDERGKNLTSPDLAQTISRWRDEGRPSAAFVIGGADGLHPEFRDGADQLLSLGRMVWPHMLARVMLTEQLYRAASILSGSPYHRD